MDKHETREGRRGRFERDLATVERDAEAARLKYDEGLTYQEIADELGFSSKGNAYRAVHRALRDVPVKVVPQLRAREFARLEFLWDCLLPGIEAGDVAAIGQGRKISESMRKLFDLDGSVDGDGADGPGDQAAIDRMLAEADEYLRAEQAKIYGSGDGAG